MENNRIPGDNLLFFAGIHVPAYLYCSRDTLGGTDMKSKNYDYYLIILTSLILLAIGLVCIYGIIYYNFLAVKPEWSSLYAEYIEIMNSYLYPFLVLLLISLGLCIPKRLLGQDILIKSSALILGATLVLTVIFNLEAGLGFILAVMIGIQSMVLIMTFRKSRAVKFEKHGYVVRLGSSLLHLGLVVLIFNFVTLRESPSHILIFWTGTLLITAGTIFALYPDRITRLWYTEQ